MRTLRRSARAPRPAPFAHPLRHDRPVDALVLWLATAAVVTGLDRLTSLSTMSGDLHGAAAGALLVYLCAKLMDRIAERAATPAPAASVAPARAAR
ncbi:MULTISPECIES: hypothetical protein [Burkholderia]|uniref:Uncharacterized protein n=1 Tax=Burkholderia singularis TaxID=1503053 RepID=A0A238GZG7_9BURK|nr:MULTISPECIES: hypothetical protein [Burkholderia]SMF98344.1 hypothetical protein BSIN_1636 [Burkholderia singularis]